MALTINPAVSGTRTRWFVHIAAFFAGVWLGGLISLAMVLAIVGGLSSVLPRAALAAVLLAVVVWAAGKDLGFPLWLPYRQRQVPEWLRDALPPGGIAAFYGVMLGVGFLTLFTYSTQLAVLVALPFVRPEATMLGAMAAFAAGKTLVLATATGASSSAAVAARFHWTRHRARVLRLTTAAMSLLVAGSIATALLH